VPTCSLSNDEDRCDEFSELTANGLGTTRVMIDCESLLFRDATAFPDSESDLVRDDVVEKIEKFVHLEHSGEMMHVTRCNLNRQCLSGEALS
jgi:hypothetical protein